MSSDLTLVRRTISDLSSDFQGSALLPKHLRNPADMALVMHMGDVLGIDPRQAIWSMHVIDGKPNMSADLMAAVCSRSPLCEYLMPTVMTPTRVEYAAKRRGWPSEVRMSFTLEDAQRAGLAGRDNWRKYPMAMLKARCLAMICRATWPDLLAGVYDPDELAPASASESPVRVEQSRPEPTRADSDLVIEVGPGTSIKAQVAAQKPRRRAPQATAPEPVVVEPVVVEPVVEPVVVEPEPEPVVEAEPDYRAEVRSRLRSIGATMTDLLSFAENALGRPVGPPDSWSTAQARFICQKLHNGWAGGLAAWISQPPTDIDADELPE
jgi:hypothetical protein